MKLYDAIIRNTEKINNHSISGIKVNFNRYGIEPMIYSGYTKKEVLHKVYEMFKTLEPIAIYSSGLWGIEIIDIIDGFDSYYVLIRENEKLSVHKTYDTLKGNYFMLNKMRIYLNDCIRSNIY